MGTPILFDAYRITGVGVTQPATTTSSNVAMPTTTNGAQANPRFVRVLTDAACYIKFGAAGVTATLNDIYITPNMPEVFNVQGQPNIGVITRTGTANINVCAVEI